MIPAPPIMDPRVNIVGVLYNAALAQYGAERLQAFVSNHESSMPDPHPKGQLLSRINQLFKSATLWRSEEHTSELQSLMRISYAVFCLNKKTHKQKQTKSHNQLYNTTKQYNQH